MRPGVPGEANIGVAGTPTGVAGTRPAGVLGIPAGAPGVKGVALIGVIGTGIPRPGVCETAW
jgi:hypothetical protein